MYYLCIPKAQVNHAAFLTKAIKTGTRVLVKEVTDITQIKMLAAKKPKGIITSSIRVIRALTKNPDATASAYAGSIFNVNGVKILIINRLELLRAFPKEVAITRQHIRKLAYPEQFIPAPFPLFTPEKFTENLDLPWKQIAEESPYISCDIETIKQDRKITIIGFTFAPSYKTLVVEFKDKKAWNVCKTILQTSTPKIFHNGRYDIAYLLRWGIPVVNYIFDTQDLMHSFYQELPKTLGFVSSLYVPEHIYWKEDKNTKNWQEYKFYNARDCYYTLRAFENMIHLAPEWGLKNYRHKLPENLPAIYCNMQGLLIDKKVRLNKITEYSKKIDETEREIEIMVNNKDYNPGSPKQTKRIFEILAPRGLKIENTDAKTARKLAETSTFAGRIVEKIQEYKQLTTKFGFLKCDIWHDHLLYTLNPFGTETGRWACKESNFWTGTQIQNQPPVAREFIKATDGWILGSIDMPQSESRTTAYISGDAALIEAVESPLDFHKTNASKFFGLNYDEITKELRNLGKRVNHGSNYNMGAYVLVETMGTYAVIKARNLLNLPKDWNAIRVAQYLLDSFAQTYPVLKGDYYDYVRKIALTTRKLINTFGYTRYTFLNPGIRKHDLNALIAHFPQNLSAEIINKAMVKIFYSLALVYPEKFKLKMQVHDEIVFMVKDTEEDKDYFGTKVQEAMSMPLKITDVNGTTRKMLIPPDKPTWGYYWSDLK